MLLGVRQAKGACRRSSTVYHRGMFAYHGKIAGVARAGTGWRYVVAIPHPEGLKVDQVGELDAAAPDEAAPAWAGSRCIYGLRKASTRGSGSAWSAKRCCRIPISYSGNCRA